MARGFLSGAAIGGAVGLAGAVVVSVVAEPPVQPDIGTPNDPVQVAPGQTEELTGQRLGDADLVTEPVQPPTDAPAPDEVSGLSAIGQDVAPVPRAAEPGPQPEVQDAPETADIAASEELPVLPSPQAAIPTEPRAERKLTVSTEPAQPLAPQALESLESADVEPEAELQLAARSDEGGRPEVSQPGQATAPQSETAAEVDATTPAQAAEEETDLEAAPEEGPEEAPEEVTDAPATEDTDTAAEEAAPSDDETTVTPADPVEEETPVADAERAETEAPTESGTESESADNAGEPVATEEPAASVAGAEETPEPEEAGTTDTSEQSDDSRKTAEDAPSGGARPTIGSPTIGSPTDGSPTVGRPAQSLIARDDNAAAPDTSGAEDVGGKAAIDTSGLPPLQAHSAVYDNPDEKPLMSIVLIDEGADLSGGAVGIAALRSFPYPLSFAVDATLPDAQDRMAAFREQGFEVLALMNLPSGARASDVEINLEAAFQSVPEAVAVIEGPGTGVQGSLEVAEQLIAALKESGHGFVLQAKGLNTIQRIAERDGVPSALVFRDFDSAGQTPTVIRRFLDQAAFRARQEGGVIMMGRLRPDTISALLLWGLQDRAGRVALSPVSAVLNAKADGSGG